MRITRKHLSKLIAEELSTLNEEEMLSMRVTRRKLKELITESLREMYEPKSPQSVMTEIGAITQEAMLNKSFGFRQETTDEYFMRIMSALRSLSGGATLPGEEWSEDMAVGQTYTRGRSPFPPGYNRE